MSGKSRFSLFIRLLIIAGVGLVVVGIWWISNRSAPLTPEEQARVERGQQIYQESCAACHGKKGEGQDLTTFESDGTTFPAPPHDDSGHTWHHPDDFLFDYVKDGGQAGMPAFGDHLTDEEIEAVLAYIKTLWTPTQRSQQASISDG